MGKTLKESLTLKKGDWGSLKDQSSNLKLKLIWHIQDFLFCVLLPCLKHKSDSSLTVPKIWYRSKYKEGKMNTFGAYLMNNWTRSCIRCYIDKRFIWLIDSALLDLKSDHQQKLQDSYNLTMWLRFLPCSTIF